MPITKICITCNAKFKVSPADGLKKKNCSLECRYNAYNAEGKKICSTCKTPLADNEYHNNNLKRENRKQRCKKCVSLINQKQREKLKKVIRPNLIEKRCQDCQELKHSSDFSMHVKHKDGLLPYCKQCKAIRYKQDKINRPEKFAQKNFRHRLARRQISLEDFQRMENEQKGICLICRRKTKKLFIDHCHETGKVRGLLCPTCNTGLGMLNDNLGNLNRAVEYLEKYKT